MARPTTVALTEDERKKFDDIGLDDINAMTDVCQLNKLAKYMECFFALPASRISRFRTERSPIWKSAYTATDRSSFSRARAERQTPRQTRDPRRETRDPRRETTHYRD